ncbi:MAG: outer membrane protein assembly factor BamD [Crocinitomicaceae bacterium]|nr:outer membrane protein assembly factor BamD [Crocinitomicaceae bacterium]|tara:strand:+ start:1303 stop:2127 length:825 start_codon:yes stop_codon:yes gene_type:complete
MKLSLLKYKSNIIFLFLCVLSLYGCSEYNKILKGSDYNLKYEKAIEYYENNQCYKSLPLLDELMSYFRMTNKGEDVYYYYAKNQYCMGDYYLAGYYYKRFVKNFPRSERAEECAFNAAICMMNNSPDYYLDQSDSYKAIDEFQLFMSKYPNSSLVDSCSFLIKDLRSRLERKSFEKAKLYYKMEKYRSAIIALNTTLTQFPDTKFREDIYFMILKANFLFAFNSVETKKVERFEETIKSYHNFVDYFSESSNLKTAETYFNTSVKEIEKLKTLN